ncbi:Cytoplasmic envelopment protein 1 [Bienertia sinuspersici]
MIGDFNCVISMEERIGSTVRQREIDPMRRCISDCDLQIYHIMVIFTLGVMANEKWLVLFQNANAVFLTEGCLDHCPTLLRMNFEVGKEDPVAWEGEVKGTAMFKVTQKLKRVKASLKELNKQGFNNLQAENTRT